MWTLTWARPMRRSNTAPSTTWAISAVSQNAWMEIRGTGAMWGRGSTASVITGFPRWE